MTGLFERWWIITTIAGAILGWGLWLGLVQEFADNPPTGWEREQSPVPYRESALQGSEQPTVGEWGLDFYRAIYPTFPTQGSKSLSFKARIPKEGMLEAWISSPPIRKRMGDRWMDICTMRGPVGQKTDPRCIGKSDIGVAVILSRLSGQAFFSVIQEDASGRQVISCNNRLETTPTLEEAISVHLEPTRSTLSVQINQQTIQCDTDVGDRIPMLRSGLRKTLISDLSYGGITATSLPQWRLWACMLSGILTVTGIGLLERKHGSRGRSVVLTTLPLLLGLWVQQWDSKVLIEDLRAAWLSPYWLATILILTPTLWLKGLTATWRETHRSTAAHRTILVACCIMTIGVLLGHDNGWIGALACLGVQGIALVICRWWKLPYSAHIPVLLGTLGGLGLVAVDSFHWAGSLWGTVGGISFGLLLLANRFVVPRFNLWSLLLMGLMLVSSEIALRATKAGLQWSNKGANTEHNEIFGWVRQANESFELFEKGQHTQYPDKGFPVAITAGNHKKRIVSFGGSTTGGAFQNDNLDEFYPALMERKLRNPQQPFEVLNQGVGGWTTWHIEAYAQQKASQLKPDIITLYVGHNDILTSVPLPYKELYPLWQRQSSSQWSQTLSSIRLYQATKYLLVSLKGAEQKVAVPIEDAKENIESIIATFPNTPIILGSEGLSPDPGILFGYNQMMRELAAKYDTVYYIETAEALSKQPPHEVFLDDCHLTTYGHQIVANLFAETILEVSKQP